MKYLGLSLFIAGCVLIYTTKSAPVVENPSVALEVTELPKDATVNGSKITMVRNLNLIKANVTYLTSQVNSGSVTKVIEDIERFNRENNNPIYLLLNTPGGSVVDGAKLISVMESSKNPIYAVNIGMSASMGFMILGHAHKRFALNRTVLMAHPASLGMVYQGEVDKLASRINYIKHFVDRMDAHIAKRAGMTYQEFKLLTQQEFWIEAMDAKERGLLDEVVSITLPGMFLLEGEGTDKLLKDFKLE